MEFHPIRTESEYEEALKIIDKLLETPEGSKEAQDLEVLSILVEAYEQKRYVIDTPYPVEAIKFRMDQLGLARKDLEPIIGSRSRVSEVLSGKRSLTLSMIRRLHTKLAIPAEVLISEVDKKRA